MWHVGYSAKAEHQGEAAGFIPRDELPNDEQLEALFAAFTRVGAAGWALAMRLASRSGVRWGELIALRPCDIEFEPHRVIRVHRSVEQSSQGLAFKAPKNSQRRTTIFPASMTEAMRAHVETVTDRRGGGVCSFRAETASPPSGVSSNACGTAPLGRQTGRCAQPSSPFGIPTTSAMSRPAGCSST